MKMKTMTLSNRFHNTEVRVRVPEAIAEAGEREAWLWLQGPIYTGRATEAEKARYRRVFRTLCWMTDCTCGVVR